MKKWIAMVLTAAVLMGLVGCRRTNKQPVSNDTKPVDSQAAAEIRQAISLLLDRNYIVEQIAQGGQIPAATFVPAQMTDADGSYFYENAGNPDYPGYYDVSADAYEENFAKAIEILRKYYAYDAETGQFRNFPTLTYLYNNSDAHRAVGEYLQNVLAGVGITVNLQNQEWNTFLNTRKEGDFSIARNGWVADYNDPICFLDMWTTDSGNNDIHFGRGEHANAAIYDLDLTPYGVNVQVENGTWAETYDVLIETIKTTADRESRYAMMHLAEDMLMETGCIVPLYHYADLYMLHRSVTGFYSNDMGYKFFGSSLVNGSGESISVCLASEPDSLDPALNSTVDGSTLISHLFAGLAKWSPDETGKVSITADCAESLPEGVLNEDGSVTYTYTLREGLQWSDGKPLTAGDFVYAWNRAADPKLGASYGYLFGLIRETSAPDDRTLVVTLHNPVGYWDELLALPVFFPVRKDAVEGNEAWATNPGSYLCNGAYTMTGWAHDSVITLQKNAKYLGAENITMEKIRFYLSDDANNMLSNFKNGTWLLIDNVPTNEVAALKKQYPEEFIVAPQIGTYYICWNINESLQPTK